MKDSTTSPPSGGINRALAVRQLMRPLDEYMNDDAVREITIPRPGEVFLLRQGQWHHYNVPLLTFDYLRTLVTAITSYNGVNSQSILSLILPDGERFQASLPPAVVDGTLSINIRKHSNLVKTLDELDAEGAFTAWKPVSGPIGDPSLLTDQDRELLELKQAGKIRDFLDLAVQYRRNIIISGKTGSGKTTFARSLIERVPTGERLITIEDVHELYLPNHPNRVHMIYGAGQEQISATECIAACMRSSPDRIFLSELRGTEAWNYLSALNTGHPGSVTTTHANSASSAYERVALLVKQSVSGNQMDIDTIRRYLFSTLDISLYFSAYKLREVYFNPGRTQ